jgi:tetratricopeptide (TPR) repeat protein
MNGTGGRAVLKVGDLFAERYIVEGRLGAGGMGAVYRVRDTFIDETIALKLATLERDDSDKALVLWELQRSEVAMARRVTHPHVARVFDLGRHDGVSYITMAFVPGQTLRDALRNGSVDVADIVRFAHHIASALAAAHAAGVLHLDLKPENIVLTEGPVPAAVLVDFGIARALGAHSTGLGTPEYVSPEQLEEQPLTGAADVFALGCVLQRAFSGKAAFAGRNRHERMQARLDSPPLPLPDHVPAGLVALVQRCLARDPGQRPTAAALERAFVEQLVLFDPKAAAPEAPPTARRRIDLGAFAGGLGRRVAAARRKLLVISREQEALAELDEILQIAPRLDIALSLRALALVRLWNRSHSASADERNALADRAAQAVAEASAGAAHLADTHLADALIADYSGDVGYAVRALRRAHAIEPLHAFSHEVLGRIELEGDVGGVDRLLLAHELDPGQLGALAAVARDHLLAGRDDEALALLDQIEAQPTANRVETRSLRLRRCLWRRDRLGARALLAAEFKRGVLALEFITDCVAALDGAFSTVELAERATQAVAATMSPKRRSFLHQLAAEGLAAVSPDEATRHVISAARLPLADLRWLDACPALDPLRGTLGFGEARAVVKERIDRAFAAGTDDGGVDVDLHAAPTVAIDALGGRNAVVTQRKGSPALRGSASAEPLPDPDARTLRQRRTPRTALPTKS